MNDTDRKISSIKTNRKLQHLLQSATLEEAGSPRLIIASISLTLVIVFLLIIWASFSEIDEVSSADGRVIHTGQAQIIQHFEGGIIDKLYVKDGDLVNKDQVVVQLDVDEINSDIKKLQGQKIGLQLDMVRLNAFIDETLLGYDDFAATISTTEGYGNLDLKRLINDSVLLLRQQHIYREDERNIIKKHINEFKTDIENLEKQVENLKDSIKSLEAEEKIHKDLSTTGSGSKVDLLKVQQRLIKNKGDLLDVQTELNTKMKTLETENERLPAVTSKFAENALQEINNANSTIMEIDQIIARLKERLKRTTVLSPAKGIVKGMVMDVGSVIAPGGRILEIVPEEQELVLEARLKPLDVGHVKVGDSVKVKISAFHFVAYGYVEGKVESISASTFQDSQDKPPYYKTIIKLSQTYVGKDPSRNKLKAGMLATCDIITGRKSLMSYLLKPIKRTFKESFRER